jgi:hypothetical protein
VFGAGGVHGSRCQERGQGLVEFTAAGEGGGRGAALHWLLVAQLPASVDCLGGGHLLVHNLRGPLLKEPGMSAGVIPIAHNSGGPRADIVVQVEGPAGLMHTGYLARTQEEYADAIMQVGGSGGGWQLQGGWAHS